MPVLGIRACTLVMSCRHHLRGAKGCRIPVSCVVVLTLSMVEMQAQGVQNPCQHRGLLRDRR